MSSAHDDVGATTVQVLVIVVALPTLSVAVTEKEWLPGHSPMRLAGEAHPPGGGAPSKAQAMVPSEIEKEKMTFAPVVPPLAGPVKLLNVGGIASTVKPWLASVPTLPNSSVPW